jgi:hypothetical protein
VNGKQLTRVAGIGDARARWFEDAMGVSTLSQLAALDVAEIDERLRAGAARRAVPAREQIERWISDAERLAGADGESEESGAWRGIGSFVVEIEAREGEPGTLRTVAHHVEDDLTRQFDGLAPRELRGWIADRIAPKPAKPVRAPAASTPAVDQPKLSASVLDPVGGAPTNVVRVGDPWEVRCEWYIDGPDAATLTGNWRVALIGEGQGPGVEVVDQLPPLIPLDGRTGPANPYVLLFALGPNAIDLRGRPQAVLDLTVALTYVTSSGAPGSLAAFAALDKVLLYRGA